MSVRRLLLGAAILLLVVGLAYGVLQQSNIPTTSNSYAQTVAVERTAIAMFTLNPALALSSTPGFAEIIYNSVLRNLTEVPDPPRPCYLDPTLLASGLATPIGDCKPFIESVSISDGFLEEYMSLNKALSDLGIQGNVNLLLRGLSAINDADYSGFTAVYSKLYVSVDTTSIEDTTALAEILKRLLDFIIGQWDSMRYITANAEISIAFISDAGTRYISTTYNEILVLQQRQPSGIPLLEALGGLLEEHEVEDD